LLSSWPIQWLEVWIAEKTEGCVWFSFWVRSDLNKVCRNSIIPPLIGCGLYSAGPTFSLKTRGLLQQVRSLAGRPLRPAVCDFHCSLSLVACWSPLEIKGLLSSGLTTDSIMHLLTFVAVAVALFFHASSQCLFARLVRKSPEQARLAAPRTPSALELSASATLVSARFRVVAVQVCSVDCVSVITLCSCQPVPSKQRRVSFRHSMSPHWTSSDLLHFDRRPTLYRMH
jgi:hypothetical protein